VRPSPAFSDWPGATPTPARCWYWRVGSPSIEVVSTAGYRRRFPAHEAGTLLLATHASGRPLSRGHGGPARIVAPGRRGFWWVKWVASIDVVDEPWWSQPPFPLQ